MLPRGDQEQEQPGSSDPVSTTQRQTPWITLLVRNRAKSGGAFIPAPPVGRNDSRTHWTTLNVKHVPYFYTVVVQGLAQETVNVAELECIHGTGLCTCEGGCMNNDNT